MKTVVILFVLMTTVNLSGWTQEKKVNNLLEKKETRSELFMAIQSNHEYMMEFMEAMKGNEHAMMMMKSNNQMMNNDDKMGMGQEHQMMNHDQMMGMMKDNPEMMQKMMGNMMEMCEKDSSMRCNMVDMMTQHPKMMNTMMQKMKGKDIKKMEDMPMMQKQKDENEQLH